MTFVIGTGTADPPLSPSGGDPYNKVWNYIWGSNVPASLNPDPEPRLPEEEKARRVAIQNAWWNAFKLVRGNKDSIEAIADSKKVDSAVLMSAVLAFYGLESPPGSFKSIRGIANKLRLRRADETLDEWFGRAFPRRFRGQLGDPGIGPSHFVGSMGYREPEPEVEVGEPPGSRWDAFSGGLRERGLLVLVKDIANEQFALGGTKGFRSGVSWKQLVAVMWADGKSASWIAGDLKGGGKGVRAYASQLARKDNNVRLNDWFDETIGTNPDRPRRPQAILGKEDIPPPGMTTAEAKEADEEREDVEDPVVATMPSGYEVRRSEFEELRTKYRDSTLWYTGVEPEDEEITRWITDGTSDYQVTVELSQRDGFFRSPAWKSHSETYKGIFREIVGTEHKLPKHLIRKAIVHNWDQGDFSEQLRQRPIYLEGNEFKSGTATLQNIYLAVQGGTITSGVKTALKEAVLARWSKDQFTAWLRAQPEYETGREHTKKVRKFNAGLASFFGQPLSRVDFPTPQPVTAFDLPDSDRIEGAGDLSQDIEQDIDVRPAESIANPRGEVA